MLCPLSYGGVNPAILTLPVSSDVREYITLLCVRRTIRQASAKLPVHKEQIPEQLKNYRSNVTWSAKTLYILCFINLNTVPPICH